MTPEQLRKIAAFVDALDDLTVDTDLHLYSGGSLYIDDEGNSSLVTLNYDATDGYTVAVV